MYMGVRDSVFRFDDESYVRDETRAQVTFSAALVSGTEDPGTIDMRYSTAAADI